MPGRRRGARSGRGWDAAPPPPDTSRRARPRRRTPAPAPEPGGAEPAGPDSWSAEPALTEAWSAEPRGPRARSAGAAGRANGSPPPERDPAEVAREICLRQLAVRPRTRAELAAALRRRGVDDAVAASVLDRYDEVGLIDDAAFARAWVSSRHRGRGLARRALASELRQRGVDAQTAGEALESLDPDTEAATARALVDRRLRSMGTVDPRVAFRRLLGTLAGKGYPPGLAIQVVKDALAAQSEEAAEFAEQIDPDAMADAAGDPDSGQSS